MPRKFQKYLLEVITVVAILVFVVLFLLPGSHDNGNDYRGTDSLGATTVTGMTGGEKDFQPLIWQWVPPSGEIESGLFAVQAAIGGIMVGWVLGYWKGQKKARS